MVSRQSQVSRLSLDRPFGSAKLSRQTSVGVIAVKLHKEGDFIAAPRPTCVMPFVCS
jgi:hypothetical protein